MCAHFVLLLSRTPKLVRKACVRKRALTTLYHSTLHSVLRVPTLRMRSKALPMRVCLLIRPCAGTVALVFTVTLLSSLILLHTVI
jgi:hypothetical protein